MVRRWWGDVKGLVPVEGGGGFGDRFARNAARRRLIAAGLMAKLTCHYEVEGMAVR